MNPALAAMLADMGAVGFTREERVAFLQAIDKPPSEVTPADLDLFNRYEAAVGGASAGAA